MLIKKLPHILVTLLVAFLVGCGGTTNPLIDQAKSNIETGNNEALLQNAEKSIEQYPGDPRGYFYKAVALGNIGESQENPADRTDYYIQMNETFETAKAVDDTTEGTADEMSRIAPTKQGHYNVEYEQGVNYLRDDSLKSTVENPLEWSMLHFKNATVILPDQPNGWNAYAITSAQNQDFESAAKAKEKYMSMAPDTSIKVVDYIQLGGFYSNLEKSEKAIAILEEGQKKFPKNADIISHLASNYISVGKPQKAIAVFEELVKENPENPEYRLKMGSEIFNQALALQDSLAANSKKILSLQEEYKSAESSNKEEIKNQIMELSDENKELQSLIDKYLDRSEEEVKKALEYGPEDAGAYETLGIIHRFRAQIVIDQYNRTPNDQPEKAAELDKKGKQLLRDAMGYYEKAVEIKPDNKNYWKNLFQIYATLGMDKKAQDAMEKAGLN